MEVIRGRFPFGKLKQKIIESRQRYPGSQLVIEDSPISKGLIQALKEKGINVVPYKPETDKVARAIAQTDLLAGGSVHFPVKTKWLNDFRAELLAFPGGRNDDQVDALMQGLAWGRLANSRRVSTGHVQGLV